MVERSGEISPQEDGRPVPELHPAEHQAELVGRTEEFDRLSKLVETILRDAGAGALVCGEPGIGKTFLAEEVSRFARRSGIRSLWGRCLEDPSAPPLWPWEQALREVAVRDERLSLGPGTLPAADYSPLHLLPAHTGDHRSPVAAVKVRTFYRLSCALRDLAQDTPVLITIDDLQWADVPTLELLEYVTREIAESPVMIVATLRPRPASAALNSAVAAISKLPNFDRIDLSGLDFVSVVDLVGRISGRDLSGSERRSVFDLTGGSPLLVRQLALTLRNRTVSLADSARYTRSLTAIVEDRLAQAPEICVDVLRIASVLGRNFHVSLVAGISGLDTATTLDALSHLMEQGLVASGQAPGEFEFVHDLLRETIRSSLGVAERTGLHAQTARFLESKYGSAANDHALELFHHYSAARLLTGCEPIERFAAPAGEEALCHYAFEEAERIFRTGLDCTPSGPMSDAQATLTFGLIRARMPTTPPHVLVDDLVRVFRHFEVNGKYGVARRVLFECYMAEPKVSPLCELALKHEQEGSGEFAWLLLLKSQIDAAYSSEPERYYPEFARAMKMVARVSELSLRLECLRMASYCRIVFGRPTQEQRQILEDARRVAQALGNTAAEIDATARLVYNKLDDGDLDDAIRHADEVCELAENCDDPYAHEAGSSVRIALLYRRYEYAELDRRLKAQLGRNLPRDMATGDLLSQRVWVLLALGRLTEARAELADLVAYARQVPDVPATIFLNTARAIVQYCEETGECYHLGYADTIVGRLIARQDVTPGMVVDGRALLARIHLVLGNPERAQSYYEATIAGLKRLPPSHQLRDLLRYPLGRIGHAVGDLDVAIDLLRIERGQCASVEGPWAGYELAAALVDRANADDLNEAQEILSEVELVASKHGLEPLQKRMAALDEILRETLRTAAAEPDKVGFVPNSAPPRDAASLTPREIEVLCFVANGYTNRDIGKLLSIATRTVDSHVARILDKIGAANRAEAAAYAAAAGLLGRFPQ